MLLPPPPTKTALVLGVANSRSIAWACVQSLLREKFNVICTYQNERFQSTVEQMVTSQSKQLPSNIQLHAVACNVEHELSMLFQERIQEFLPQQQQQQQQGTLDAIVHSVAYASPESMKQGSLSETTLDDFLRAHHISAYSFLETARLAKPLLHKTSASLTTISYLGANRAIPNYNVMGPAKASLESIVRGLALELGQSTHGAVRVNAVSAGPLNTLAARGIAGFSDMRQEAAQQAPLQRNVTPEEVADTVAFLATRGTGITGQTIYVDGGYSIVGGPMIRSIATSKSN